MATAATERFATLDATRGAAVMGILLINIISFSMPEQAYVSPRVWGGLDLPDIVVWTINQLFFEGRMRGLFALLFGASAMLVMARAEAKSEGAARVHLSRMAALALFGLAHCYLVWEGDVLFHYAVLGCLLLLVRGWSVKALVRAAIVLLALHTLYWGVQFAGALYFQSIATAPDATAEMVRQYQAMMRGFPGPDSPTIARDLAGYRGDYATVLDYRLEHRATIPVQLLFILGGETLGYMLLGMALMKSGLFTGGWDRARVRRFMIVCYAVSLPAMAAITLWQIASGFDPIVLMGVFLGWSIPFRVVMTLAHAALIVLLVTRFSESAIVARIAAAGRMAFTNYLMTSIVMTTIFYGYGLGLFGHVGRAEVYLFVFAMWALMLAWSKPWLDRFVYGPFEWAWRSLARLRPQPMRRTNHLAS
ncbi:DUF418 domain-containing protein [Sphingomonas gilva]|uniref:DUF418 domain-containing protein n=1 Tax=Sphingomonas gilva TaxID=2305907 RepID=A0A396RNT2_9SPHN|nr:DUF418 domain-containing protein [Sphingomonas gilva]RHW18078.1 DUF418 domain-containing protein [Sphingomonas gilva]